MPKETFFSDLPTKVKQSSLHVLNVALKKKKIHKIIKNYRKLPYYHQLPTNEKTKNLPTNIEIENLLIYKYNQSIN